MRDEVQWFAELMEVRLREKDPKRNGNSWGPSDLEYLHKKLIEKYNKVEMLVDMYRKGGEIDQAGLRRLAADLGNYTMMITDILSWDQDDND